MRQWLLNIGFYIVEKRALDQFKLQFIDYFLLMKSLQSQILMARSTILQILALPLSSELTENITKIKKILEFVSQFSNGSENGFNSYSQEIKKLMGNSTIISLPVNDANGSIMNGKKKQLEQSQRNEESQSISLKTQQQISYVIDSFGQTILRLLNSYENKIFQRDQKENQQILQSRSIQQIIQSVILLKNQLTKFLQEKQNNMESTQKNYQKTSENQRKNQSNSQSGSSVRSLLTQKMKQIPIQYEDDEIFSHQKQVVIKSNWMLRQIKKNTKQQPSEPLNNISNMSVGSQQNNPKSMYYEPFTRSRGSRMKLPSQREILREIDVKDSSNKETKAKKDESGCARCQIY